MAMAIYGQMHIIIWVIIMTSEEKKITYILWCAVCNKKALAPFPPLPVAIDLEKVEKPDTIIFEHICNDCFNNQDA
jgi:hypothetical protein